MVQPLTVVAALRSIAAVCTINALPAVYSLLLSGFCFRLTLVRHMKQRRVMWTRPTELYDKLGAKSMNKRQSLN